MKSVTITNVAVSLDISVSAEHTMMPCYSVFSYCYPMPSSKIMNQVGASINNAMASYQ